MSSCIPPVLAAGAPDRELRRRRPRRRSRSGRRSGGVVAGIRGGQRLIERGQRPDVRDGGQVATAEPADLAFHPALLMHAVQAGGAEERVAP